ncbi:MAG TPA: membrane protein insertion efficiency factor YidD [Lentisphaeria bacterium]|nr:MAG: membrane protein insertion efficiency factor YidD [Lentisphaerae bacterium GWF2_38_69]HBM15006.1 membrane protein insertion efficiency factor YidD [Lentisphaeria bacterium]
MEGRTNSLVCKNPLAYILIKIIRIYQYLTPWLNCCRFYPSCSEYSAQAIGKHGVIIGLLLTIYRLLRCQPYCKSGYDPVPEKIEFKFKSKKVIKGDNV